MLRSLAVLCACLVAGPAFAQAAATPAGAALSSNTPAAVEEPRDVVAAICRLAIAELRKARPSSPFFERAVREKYFSKSFDLLVTKAEVQAAHDGDALIDFDPISASQDPELKKLTLKTDLLESGKAMVSASFFNHAQEAVVTYAFVKEDGAWKVDDIRGTTEKEAWSVRKILTASGKPPEQLPGMPGAAKGADANSADANRTKGAAEGDAKGSANGAGKAAAH